MKIVHFLDASGCLYMSLCPSLCSDLLHIFCMVIFMKTFFFHEFHNLTQEWKRERNMQKNIKLYSSLHRKHRTTRPVCLIFQFEIWWWIHVLTLSNISNNSNFKSMQAKNNYKELLLEYSIISILRKHMK